MTNAIFCLSDYLLSKNRSRQSHYYRKRHLLSTACSDIKIFPWINEDSDEELLKILSQYAPLNALDLENKKLSYKLNSWNKTLPHDQKFFKMCLKQLSFWKSLSSKTLKDFIYSPEGENWYRKRKQLKRKSFFELDMPYKSTKTSALIRCQKARQLMREYPLLRWEDLRQLGLRNAQAIYENFPFRKHYRQLYLENLRPFVHPDEDGRRVGSADNF